MGVKVEILEGKPKIDYPTNWIYKVIGEDKQSIENKIKQILTNKDHTIKISNHSKGGKYISLHLEVLVFNDDERIFIFEELKSSEVIKFVV